MTKEALSDKVRSLLDQHITAFIEQKSAAAEEAQKRIEELEKQKQAAKKALGDNTAAFKAAVKEIEREQKSLTVDEGANRRANRRAAAEALVIAANHWRLPLVTKKQPGSRSAAHSEGDGRGRMSRAQIEEAAEKVYGVLPPSNTSDQNCKAPSVVSEAAGLSFAETKSALSKLRRDRRAESNGLSGRAGGWRRSKSG